MIGGRRLREYDALIHVAIPAPSVTMHKSNLGGPVQTSGLSLATGRFAPFQWPGAGAHAGAMLLRAVFWMVGMGTAR